MRTRFLTLGLTVAGAIAACNYHEVDEADAKNTTLEPTGTGGTDSSGGEGGLGTGAEGGMGVGPGTGGSGAVGSVPGIACGDDTCTPGAQKCCSTKTCYELAEPCPSDGLGVDDVFSEMLCDDDYDCMPGETCCVESHPMEQGLLYECKTGTCGLHPSCTVDSRCTGGLVCVQDPTEETGGKCVDPASSVACGGALVCEGSSPVCCVSGSDTCVAYGVCGGLQEYAFECDDAADCGTGYVCCTDKNLSGSACAGSCADVILCAGDGECGGKACVPAGGVAPPSFKSCQ